MARVKAPLLSLDARGGLGGVIQYQNWKGIPVVRTHSRPSGKPTAKQLANREMWRVARDFSQDSRLTARDLAAWRRFASRAASPLSVQNQLIRQAMQVQQAGQDLIVFHHLEHVVGAYNIYVSVHAPEGSSVAVRWGRTLSNLCNSSMCIADGTLYYYYIPWCTSLGKCYWQFIIKKPDEPDDDDNKSGVDCS